MTYALFYFKQGLLCQQLNEKPVLLLKTNAFFATIITCLLSALTRIYSI